MSNSPLRSFGALRAAGAAILVTAVLAGQIRVTLANAMETVLSTNAVDAKVSDDNETHAWSLQEAVAWNPHDYHALYRLGSYHLGREEDDLARTAYERCLQSSPGHLGALLALADIHTRAGEFEQAQSYLDEAIRVAPTSWRAYLSAGTLASRRGDQREAIALLEKADHLARFQQIGVYNKLALAHLMDGDTETSLEYAEISLAGKRRNPEAALVKGKALLVLGRFGEAVAPLEFASRHFSKKKDPLQRSDARLHLAGSLMETGKLGEASEIVRDEVRAAPGQAQVQSTAVRLCRTLAARLESAPVSGASAAAIQCNLGYTYAALGMLEDADERFAEAVASGAELETACVWAHAETLLRLEKFDAAAERYEDGLSRGPAPVHMRLGFAESLAKAGRSAEARLQYQLALQGYPLEPAERATIQGLLDALD